MEERRLFLPAGPRGERNAVTLPPFTFIGATTDEYRLSKPLRDRFKIVVRLEHYSEAELVQLLGQRVRRLGWAVEEAAIAALATKGRGTPRIAIRLLEASRRVSRADGSNAITAAHVARMMEIEGVDSLGLDSLEQRYLQILRASSSPVRLNILATMLGMPRRTIEVVIESDLLRLGLIMKDDDGRSLTPQGREHGAADKRQPQTSSEGNMPSRTNVPSGLRAAVSVSQMAKMLRLSRASFYEHVRRGNFLAPIYSLGTRRPIYTAEMQQRNLEVKATQMGANGEYVLFYERQPRGQRVERRLERRDQLLQDCRRAI